MTGDAALPAEWMPPHGEMATPVAAGVHWDGVRVGDPTLALAVLAHLGRNTGAVIQDGRTGVSYWLVRPQAADAWPAMPAVSVLARGDFLAIPPVWLTRGPGPHWRVPYLADSYLTPPDLLRGALRAAVERTGAPGAGGAGTDLASVQRARRDAALRTRLREINHRSTTREVRPW